MGRLFYWTQGASSSCTWAQGCGRTWYRRDISFHNGCRRHHLFFPVSKKHRILELVFERGDAAPVKLLGGASMQPLAEYMRGPNTHL